MERAEKGSLQIQSEPKESVLQAVFKESPIDKYKSGKSFRFTSIVTRRISALLKTVNALSVTNPGIFPRLVKLGLRRPLERPHMS